MERKFCQFVSVHLAPDGLVQQEASEFQGIVVHAASFTVTLA
ncbi:hypothetical protein [Methylobacterium sp. NMS14P]|nr:hypothetical protein [Methylobacterium sp. NMS14P]